MIVIPAIDLKNGKCVRLWQGKKEEEKVYFSDPVSVAKMWEDQGAERLHLIDLEGAFQGSPVNLGIAEKIAGRTNLILEFGGGIRSFAVLKQVFDSGINFAVIGSKALSSEFVEMACQKYPERILAAIDSREGKVSIEGWQKQTRLTPTGLADNLFGLGIRTVIFTDIKKDGTLTGVDIEVISNFVNKVKQEVIVAGGVSSLKDLGKIADLGRVGILGVIIGKALYEGRIQLKEALGEI